MTLDLFPKKQRHTLGQKLEQFSLDYFELLFLASRRQEEKELLLERAKGKLELIKVLLRLAKDTKSLDNKKYIHLESYLQEIGKMLGGWIKHAKQNT